QPLRHVGVDAHHSRALEHLLRLQAGAAVTAGAGHPRVVPGAARDAGLAAPADAGVAHLDQLLPGRGLAPEAPRALAADAAAHAGGAAGRRRGARTLRGQTT